MKKLALFLLGFCLFFASCGTDYSIKYDGPNVVNIVLLEELNLNIKSDEVLTYTSDNELVVTVSQEGIIMGKNVGEANVTVSNAEQELTLHVVVSLFEEPSVQFGASTDYIESIYGEPRYNFGDSIMIYGSGEIWYSYAVWEMDFFFKDNHYFESDLYIREDLKKRINSFLDEKYYYSDSVIDTITNDDGNDEIVTIYLYLNKPNAEDASFVVGKQYNAGPYDDICLIYAPYIDNKSQPIISRDRRRK